MQRHESRRIDSRCAVSKTPLNRKHGQISLTRSKTTRAERRDG